MAETFSEIKQLTRDLANLQGEAALTDALLEASVNNAYQNKLPSYLGISLDRTWKFSTVPYQGVYPVGVQYRLIDGNIRLNGEQLNYFTEPDIFYATYPDNYQHERAIGTGDGATSVFTGTLETSYRIIPESLVIAAPLESFTDNGSGVLTGTNGGTGTIVYSTAAFSVIFGVAPADSIAIGASYAIYNESQPSAVLLDNADTSDGGTPELVFRPIPDSAYLVEVDYEARPTALSAASDEPIRKVWGDLIAYIAALDLLGRYGSWQEQQAVRNDMRRILDDVLGYEVKVQGNVTALPRW